MFGDYFIHLCKNCTVYKNSVRVTLWLEMYNTKIVFYPRDAMLARVFATSTCLSVCPSGRPSHAGIVPSRAKAGWWNVHCL